MESYACVTGNVLTEKLFFKNKSGYRKTSKPATLFTLLQPYFLCNEMLQVTYLPVKFYIRLEHCETDIGRIISEITKIEMSSAKAIYSIRTAKISRTVKVSAEVFFEVSKNEFN